MNGLLNFYGMSGALGVNLEQIIDDVLHKDDKMSKSLEWYKKLDLNQRINLKELTEIICGMPYTFMIKVFGFKEAIFHIHSKLEMEGFDV